MGIASQQEQKQGCKANEQCSSITAPQQERRREAAGMEQKQAGTQNECKDVTTGMWQEEGKRNSIRNAEGTSSSAGASRQKRRRRQQERSRTSTGLQQERSKNDWSYSRYAKRERSRNSAGLYNRNATKTAGAVAGTQQEFGKAATGMQRNGIMHGATADK